MYVLVCCCLLPLISLFILDVEKNQGRKYGKETYKTSGKFNSSLQITTSTETFSSWCGAERVLVRLHFLYWSVQRVTGQAVWSRTTLRRRKSVMKTFMQLDFLSTLLDLVETKL